MAATNESMADLAERLSTYFERTVIDRTGLAGSFDFRCDYRAVPSQLEVTEVIHTCLHDVGLRLESTRATVAQLVIDRAERPTAN